MMIRLKGSVLRCELVAAVAGFNQEDIFSHCGVQNLISYSLAGYSCTVRVAGRR
jgi:hypothetical protein